jgi:hypothetical protein
MAGLLRASEEGLRIVDIARRNPGWNKTGDAWCQAALTSKATLKRFWAQQPIRRETFIDICKAVGIHNWEDIIERRDIQLPEPLPAAANRGNILLPLRGAFFPFACGLYLLQKPRYFAAHSSKDLPKARNEKGA